jgi:hypothetical protein
LYGKFCENFQLVRNKSTLIIYNNKLLWLITNDICHFMWIRKTNPIKFYEPELVMINHWRHVNTNPRILHASTFFILPREQQLLFGLAIKNFTWNWHGCELYLFFYINFKFKRLGFCSLLLIIIGVIWSHLDQLARSNLFVFKNSPIFNKPLFRITYNLIFGDKYIKSVNHTSLLVCDKSSQQGRKKVTIVLFSTKSNSI